MKVSVLGCGRWGSFLAWYVSRLGHEVVLFGRESSAAFSSLVATRKNEYVDLPENIVLSSDLNYSVKRADIIIISISAQGLDEFFKHVNEIGIENKKIVLCMKGIESSTGRRLSSVVIDCGANPKNVAVWVGPGHIQEFSKSHPNCMVIDSANHDLTVFLCDLFKSDLIRFYYGNDLIGSEIGAAAKNVMGIAAGMLDGGGYSALKGPLMARGAREVSRLIKAMGGDELSAYGLCHLGDYETTLFSEYSNNRRFGEAYMKGEPFGKLAEGVMTAKAMLILEEKYQVELPITRAVYNVIFEHRDPMNELLNLFSRKPKKEFN